MFNSQANHGGVRGKLPQGDTSDDELDRSNEDIEEINEQREKTGLAEVYYATCRLPC